MSDPVYCYPPDYTVLKNNHDIRDRAELERVERRLVADRIAEGAPRGKLNLAHLQAIHNHLFQDVYEWAGKVRTVENSLANREPSTDGYKLRCVASNFRDRTIFES